MSNSTTTKQPNLSTTTTDKKPSHGSLILLILLIIVLLVVIFGSFFLFRNKCKKGFNIVFTENGPCIYNACKTYLSPHDLNLICEDLNSCQQDYINLRQFIQQNKVALLAESKTFPWEVNPSFTPTTVSPMAQQAMDLFQKAFNCNSNYKDQIHQAINNNPQSFHDVLTFVGQNCFISPVSTSNSIKQIPYPKFMVTLLSK